MGPPMSSALPARRFREAQLLIGAALVMVLAAVLVELRGVLELGRLAEDGAGAGASAAAGAAAGLVAALPRDAALPPSPTAIGLAVLDGERVTLASGAAGPAEPPWWPWHSRIEWEAHERGPAGPVQLAGVPVMVAYEPLPDGRVVRAVVPATSTSAVRRWRSLAGAMALIVAGGGALLAWLLVARVVAPYRELLAAAARVTPQPDGQAEDRFLVSTFQEAVERLQRSEAALRQRADELGVLSEVLTREATSGVVIADAQGVVRGLNPVARELLGAGLTSGHPIPAALAVAGGRVELAERAVEVRRFPLRSSTGQPQGEVCFLTDRTELEGLERAMREREGMATLGELSAGMAHELRNALATIQGYLRLLASADPERGRRYMAAIEAEAATVSSVLDRFLHYAEPRELRREAIGLRRLAEDSVQRVRGLFPALVAAVEGEDAVVEGDPLAFAVVLDNLVRNAAEALESRGGRVVLRIETAASSARVTVEDNGPGVSAEVRERLFAPFASTKASGGLGLALARRLVRLHGGELTYTQALGGGARFVVTLPREGTS